MVKKLAPDKPIADMDRSELVAYIQVLRSNNDALSRTVERFEETFVEIQGVTRKVDSLETELHSFRTNKNQSKEQLREQSLELKEVAEELEIKKLTFHRVERTRQKVLKYLIQLEDLVSLAKESLATKFE